VLTSKLCKAILKIIALIGVPIAAPEKEKNQSTSFSPPFEHDPEAAGADQERFYK